MVPAYRVRLVIALQSSESDQPRTPRRLSFVVKAFVSKWEVESNESRFEKKPRIRIFRGEGQESKKYR
jgi:hypothetical protein